MALNLHKGMEIIFRSKLLQISLIFSVFINSVFASSVQCAMTNRKVCLCKEENSKKQIYKIKALQKSNKANACSCKKHTKSNRISVNQVYYFYQNSKILSGLLNKIITHSIDLNLILEGFRILILKPPRLL